MRQARECQVGQVQELKFSDQSHNPTPHPVSLYRNIIEWVVKYKYLRTVLTSKLDFTANTALAVEKVSKWIYISISIFNEGKR